ncbi:MAG: hypothetical protein K2L22_06140 [Muribaculaceae bacterium]|nr:hypothetical protein [Muribaculaceae bacterium]
MKKSLITIRAVALLATVVLFGGMTLLDASAKTVKTPKKPISSQMKTLDFAYPQTVAKNADAALQNAVAHGDWPASVEAAIQSVTADNLVSHENALKGIAKIDSIADIAPASWQPAFLLIKADIYNSIYGQNRWKADNRKLPLDSIPENPFEWSREVFADKVFGICSNIMEKSSNDSRPLSDWSNFIENASDAYSLNMTVEEFLCSRCFSLLEIYADSSRDVIPFFAIDSQPSTPAQKCAALRDKAIDRLIESATRRGQSVLLALALTDKANTLSHSMRMKFFVEAYDKVKATEGEQIILSQMRDFVFEEPAEGIESLFPYGKKEYIDMLRKSITDFPKGRYVNSLKNIINDMTRPYSEILYKRQYLSSSEITFDVKLSNCNESWALVYDYSPYADITNNPPKTKEVAARCRLVKAIRLSVEGNVPFTASTKANVGKLLKGTYVVIPSASPDAKGIYSNILNDSWREPFTVSDISVMTLQGPDAKTLVFVVDGYNGRPIEGAQVKIYSRRNYTSSRQLVNTLMTDKDGCVSVSTERFEIEALFNGSKWSSDSRYYNSSSKPDTTERKRVQILAERALCHPGDSIKAAVIAYSSKETKMYLNEGSSLDIILRDANGNDVSTNSVMTDRFGRATVEFLIPEQGLLGNWQLVAQDADKKWLGSTSIQVADYVAPTFFISSEQSEEDVNPGDIVSLKGQVLTYSGMPVGGATVRYSVSYTPPMRWFSSGFATFDSSVVADADGKYTIELPTANLKGTQFERGVFSVRLSATSPAGETQNGPTERFSIGKEFHIEPAQSNLRINISKGEKDIIVNVTDILGRKVKKEVFYELSDSKTFETVDSGYFTSPVLRLPLSDLPSASYDIDFYLKDDNDVTSEMEIVTWRDNDLTAPVGTSLWVPETNIIAEENKSVVSVTIGSGVPDRWIPAVLSTDGEIISTEWLHVEKDNLKVPVKIPGGNNKYKLNLSWLSDLNIETENVNILPASYEERLKVATESFRDKVSAGDVERWSFRFFRKSSYASGIPAMAVMTDAALNAITPFNWNLNPNPNRYGSYYDMRVSYNSYRNLHTSLLKSSYLPWSTLSMPIINDYGQGWGLNNRVYLDGGVAYLSGCAMGEMAMMRSSAPQKMMMKAAPAMNTMATADLDMAVTEEAEEEADDALSEVVVAGFGFSGAPETTDSQALRETECPVAFFMPNLISNNDGIVNIDFTVPNFNTTWAFQLLGYDNELQTAKTALETVASKPIMVSTHSPRFVRTGDVIELTATVFNNSDISCSPKCRIELVDLLSGKSVAEKDFTPGSIDPSASTLINMSWTVPSNVSAIGFRAYAEAENHRDGEQSLLPVLPASSPIVESTPFWIAPEEKTLEVKLPKFKDTDQVTLQYCDNPVWYCITALPDIVKPESKSIISKIKALFGNAIAFNLISTRPDLRNGLEILLSDKDSEFAAIKSNLEKDGNLKITQISNTPWVNNAESETLRMSRLESLLNDSEAQKTISDILNDVRGLQMPNGGWSWCPEMEASPWISRDVLRHFAMIVKAGADGCLDNSRTMISKGIKYVDSETVKDYKKYHKKGESLSYLLDWLFVRSSFPSDYLPSDANGREMTSIAAKAYKDIASEWKEWSVGEKAKAASVLWRAGDHKTANEILESLRQFASETPEKGIWFDNLNSGWGGMSALQTTTLVLEAFSEIQPINKIVDGLRQWLVLGRQYQDWGKNTYTVETVNAILTSGSDWHENPASKAAPSLTEFYLKGKKLNIPDPAKLTGAFTLTLNPKDASGKTLSISRNGASPAWGGVISQYEAPIIDVVPADVPELSIRKSVVALVEGKNGELIPKEGITLEKGMKVRVTLFITAGRDMDYVAVTDERSACLEPVDQLSGYTASDRVGFYREIRDAQTNLFFEWMPKGQHVISYDCTVSQDGTFSCGIATAQSQYSPTTVAHSAGSILQVK